MNDSIVPLLTTSSSRMVAFLLSLTPENLPSAIVREARIRLFDGLGCGLYGVMTPWGKIVSQVVCEEQSQGRATIFGNRHPIAPARAALINGTAIHAFELDDIAPGHAGAAVVPAVLATAQQYELSGIRMLLGVIAGYEATSRISIGIGKARLGLHISSIAGAVGAAVASGVTLGMPHEQLMRAVGIACSSAAGIKSFVQGTGGMIKRLHAGRAAESGVLACLLAQRGFTAPLAALDGKFGLVEVFGSDKSDPQALDSKLGERFVVSQVWTKLYPMCGALLAMTQALYALRVEHGIERTAIKNVRIGVKHSTVKIHADAAPKETVAAQYSVPFCAALALLSDPKDPSSFAGNALNDPALCDLAKRVELYVDPEIDAEVFPRKDGANVAVHLTSGRILSKKLLDAHGMPTDPCSEDEIKEKFCRLASATITDESIAEVLSLISRIETLSSISPLSKALCEGVRD